jgi:glycine dehydrogenase subunit 1
MRAGMYLAVMGRAGLTRAARTCHLNAAYFARAAAGKRSVRVVYARNFFNEVLIEVRQGSACGLAGELRKQGILAGVPLAWFDARQKDRLLLAFSEVHDRSAIDRLLAAIGE